MNDTVRKAERIYQDGLALMAHKYYANALSCFEQSIDLNPDCAQAWFQVGRCRSEVGPTSKSKILKNISILMRCLSVIKVQ